MSRFLLVFLILINKNLNSQTNDLLKDSLLKNALEQSNANIYVIGETHSSIFPNEQYNLIKYLYYKKNIRKIGFECIKIEEAYINNYILNGDEYYFSIHNKNYSSKEKFILLRLIRDFNKTVEDKISIFCFDCHNSDFSKFIKIFSKKYKFIFKNNQSLYDDLFSKKNTEIIFLNNVEKNIEIIKNVLKTEYYNFEEDVNSFICYKQMKIKESYQEKNKIREEYILKNIIKELNLSDIIVITGSNHANLNSNYYSFKSFSSMILEDNKFKIFSITSETVVKNPFFNIFDVTYHSIITNSDLEKLKKNKLKFLIYDDLSIFRNDNTNYYSNIHILYNGLEYKRKIW